MHEFRKLAEFNLANLRNSCILICETHPKNLTEWNNIFHPLIFNTSKYKRVDKVNVTYSFIRLEFLLKTSFGKCFNLLFESVLQQKRKSVLTQIVKG